jgi:hypothetical protein
LETSISDISSGGLSYEVTKSIRAATPQMDTYLGSIAALLNVPSVTYDYCVSDNLPVMVANGYGEDRFGEIFLNVYLENLFDKLKSFVTSDVGFAAAFVNNFTSRKIIIRYGGNSLSDYHVSSFTPNGDLLVEFRQVWCNINYIGNDIPEKL